MALVNFVFIIHPEASHRAQRDDPSTAEWRGVESSRHRRVERDGLALVPPNREGWKRPDTVDRREMGSHRHRRVERDGLALVPPNGEGWKRPDTVERRGMGSHRHRRVERDGPSTADRRGMVSP